MKLRIVNIDFYASKPHPLVDQCVTQFQTSEYNCSFKVPVLRLFGVTELGQKACLHVHQVYPYIYIPYESNHLEGLDQYIVNMGHSINHAISYSLQQKQSAESTGFGKGKNHYIMSIHLVKGIKFYGFSPGYQYFLKIYLLNPQMQTRLVKLLEEGAVMGKHFEVYDNYQFVQQFMIDYNLAGMDMIEIDFFKFRLPILPIKRDMDAFAISRGKSADWFTESAIKSSHSWSADSGICRISYCELELDTWSCNIVNRSRVKERREKALVTPGALRESSTPISDIPSVPSLAAVWKDEISRREKLGLDQYNVPSCMNSSSQRAAYTPWKRENRYREEMIEAIHLARQKKDEFKAKDLLSSNMSRFAVDSEPPSSSPLFQKVPCDGIPTAFQGISLLHPQKQSFASAQHFGLEPLTSSQPFSSQLSHLVDCTVIVDETKCTQLQDQISSQEALAILQQMAESDEDDDEEYPLSQIQKQKLQQERLAQQSTDPFDGLLDEMDWANFNGLEDETIADDCQEKLLDKQKADIMYEPSTSPVLTSLRPGGSTKRSISPIPLQDQTQRKRHRIPQFDGAFDEPGRSSLFSKSPRTELKSGKAAVTAVSVKAKKKVRFTLQLPISPSIRPTIRLIDEATVDIGHENFPKDMLEQGVYRDRGGLWSPILSSTSAPHDWAFFADPPRATSPTKKIPSELNQVEKLRNPIVLDLFDEPDHCDELQKGSTSPPRMLPLSLKRPIIEECFGGSYEDSDCSLGKSGVFKFCPPPPTASQLLSSLQSLNIPTVLYTEPFVSDRHDAPRKVVMDKKEHVIGDNLTSSLPHFTTNSASYRGIQYWKQESKAAPNSRNRFHDSKFYTFYNNPPSLASVQEWLKRNPKSSAAVPPAAATKAQVSQLEHPTMKNPHGFKFSQTQIASLNVEKQHLVTISLEVHTQTKTAMLPNPEKDPVVAVFYCVQADDYLREDFVKNSGKYHLGIIAIEDQGMDMKKSGLRNHSLTLVKTEQELMDSLIQLVRSLDPDILCGWEIQKASWGYVIQRAKLAFARDFCLELSRIIPSFSHAHALKEEDEWGHAKQSSLYSSGRIFLNTWRIMRKELAITSYTLENVVFHILHQRTPKFTNETLSQWYKSGMLLRWRTLKYYSDRAVFTMELLNRTEWLNQTSEFARVYGVLLYSVLLRGSQFKVEAVMARIARPENFIINTPSRDRVRLMRPPQSIALNKEPNSQLYTSPVAVLDFQSLYPSLMIAYNYCYSTFLGFARNMCDGGQLGALKSYYIDPEIVELLQDHINVAPNGMVFVKPHIRQGVLGRMVGEILDTRIMVKQSMKLYKDSKGLTRILHAKQLGLKLLANVTYGYTAASFTGTMPCSEIADAIVESGRATLERCIEFIHSKLPRWGAKVVYADTDSLFVHLPGKSRDQAFSIGQEITDTITSMNPVPIKLQFEKVYLPCILLSKKRYAGFKFESPDVKEPVFEAKGIETVRRDVCPAAAKCLETSLKILFRTKDLSLVKAYLYRQFSKIMEGRVSKQDFIIAKEVKLGSYRSRKSLPNGAYIAEQKMAEDEQAEPEYGDRVPYVIVYRKNKTTLRQSSVTPEEAVNNPSLMVNAEYYILKQIIAPIQRVFSLLGVDVIKWYNEMPKISRAIRYSSEYHHQNADSDKARPLPLQNTIDSYFKSKLCLVCETNLVEDDANVCDVCLDSESKRASASLKILYRVREAQDKYRKVLEICRSCTSHSSALDVDVKCVSIDCPVYYSRADVKRKFLIASQHSLEF